MFIKAIMRPMRAGGLGRLRRRRGNSPLGCPGCKPRPLGRRLGQDVTDTYDAFAQPVSIDVPYANEPAYSGGFSTTDIVGSNPNPYTLPGLTNGPIYPSGMTSAQAINLAQNGPGGSPSNAAQSALLTAAINAGGAVASSALKPAYVPVGQSGLALSSGAAASFNSYLPIIVLGFGGNGVAAIVEEPLMMVMRAQRGRGLGDIPAGAGLVVGLVNPV